MVLIGVTTFAPIGVDVERLRAIPDADDVAARFFAPGELRALRCLPRDDRIRGFLNCWTRKEAVIKATGTGFAMPLDGFEVTLEPDSPVIMLKSPALGGQGNHWSLHHIEAGSGYIGAVAVRADRAPRVVLRDVSDYVAP